MFRFYELMSFVKNSKRNTKTIKRDEQLQPNLEEKPETREDNVIKDTFLLNHPVRKMFRFYEPMSDVKNSKIPIPAIYYY